MPSITLSSFFPDWEHSGCVPLDGFRESSFAGSRNMQLLVSRENLFGIFVCSLQVHSLCDTAEPKSHVQWGWRAALLETAANPT